MQRDGWTISDNLIATLPQRIFHYEYRTYPEVALREALMNAFCHANFRLGGPYIVRQHPSKLESSNPGGLVGGVTPENILHHPPMARNPLLVDALTRLRLVNRLNLGMSCMYSALLVKGKEPPIIEDAGEAVRRWSGWYLGVERAWRVRPGFRKRKRPGSGQANQALSQVLPYGRSRI